MMRRLQDNIYAIFNPDTSLGTSTRPDGRSGFNGRDLQILCYGLVEEQQNSWLELGKAYGSLADVRVRDLECDGFTVRLQHNPGRMINSLASVDRQDIGDRKCFLCTENLPPEQKGILYRDEYLILCNPRPVFHSHLTVTHIDHCPQTIANKIDAFLQLAADLDSGWAVLYNGPQCGASAPDHLHFQVVPSGQMPIEQVIVDEKRQTLLAEVDGISLCCVRDVGREIVILAVDDRIALADAFRKFLSGLQKVLGTDEEPMMNIAGFYDEGTWRLVIFPRAKHRPDVFFREDDERVVVSPAVIEMGGVIITPVERDFGRLDAPLVESIYREVSLDAAIVDKSISAML
jgi:hypothetical protein